MNTPDIQPPHPPETLEGWYALHQVFTLHPNGSLPRVESTQPGSEGWSVVVNLIGSKSDRMVIHFRSTLEAIQAAQITAAGAALSGATLDYSFLSVTEAGLYHLTAQLAREAAERGGTVGDEKYLADLAQKSVAER